MILLAAAIRTRLLRIIFRPFRAQIKTRINPGLEAALLHPGLRADAPSALNELIGEGRCKCEHNALPSCRRKKSAPGKQEACLKASAACARNQCWSKGPGRENGPC